MLLKKLGPVRELRLGRTGDESTEGDRALDADSGSTPASLQLEIGGVGVSLIDEEPRELLYVSLQRLYLSARHSGSEQSVHLTLGHLQARRVIVTASTHRLRVTAARPPARDAPHARGRVQVDNCLATTIPLL